MAAMVLLCLEGKVKVKFTLQEATKPKRGIEVYLYSFINLST